jgi:hypothetical protein
MITVIMASYLGEYPGSRKNPIQKFIRAVKSFQEQTLKEKQLIIVSDGCGLTNSVYEDMFKLDQQITLIRFEKQEGWPGPLREAARSIAKYSWILYLDSDDFIINNYLENISNEIIKNNLPNNVFGIKKYLLPFENGIVTDNHIELFQKVYNREYLENALNQISFMNGVFLEQKYKVLIPKLKFYNSTWQIVHNNNVNIKWGRKVNLEGGEDKEFINSVFDKYNLIELDVYGYVVCHHQDRSKIDGKTFLDF